MEDCLDCEGTGLIRVVKGMQWMEETCPVCQGSGMYCPEEWGEDCPVCDGTGFTEEEDGTEYPCDRCGGTGNRYIL